MRTLSGVVLDARFFAIEDFLAAAQVQLNAKLAGKADKRIVLAIDEHVAGALHVCLFVTDERVRCEDLGCTILAKPPFQGVLSKRAIPAWFLDVWQLGHGQLSRVLS
ncbi:hypothetical protein [Pseudomonas putida]|uniref:hypothetical protein n=1 Tax=Pseudomonas putida TaxID=303 RepID=UPI0033019B58|nr:hypothetical protein [Pseudomonas putida]